ncbi:MAG: DUF4293 family protein [Bacteroidales bacterium]|nr:DUF4293 domain-containing protein [Bacteroidales bacterium]MDD6773652.1 DUF4293 family protein [Bacteroidales bacterium]MDO4213652.1 DUF4293 family protein [Bacteroidales bacterium]
MWQRIQTLYLFLSTVLSGLMFFFDKAPGVRYTAYIPYAVLMVIILLLNLLALTTYKFRIFQFRTAVLAALISFAFQVWIAVDFFTADSSLIFNMTAVIPVISVILNVLAARNIMADELMVRSSDRLRSAKRKKR